MIVKPHAAAGAVVSQPRHQTQFRPAADSSPATVLIVDDDDETRETFARMLQLIGYVVITAPNGEAGLWEARTQCPDAILLDLRMPFLSGLDFLRRLRDEELHNRTPVAIITGDYFLDEATAAQLHDLGAQIHFKPLWLEHLVDLTRAMLTPRT